MHVQARFDQKGQVQQAVNSLCSQHHLDSAGLLHFSGCRLITHQRIWPRVSKDGVVSILFCLSFYLSLPGSWKCCNMRFFFFLFRHFKCAAPSGLLVWALPPRQSNCALLSIAEMASTAARTHNTTTAHVTLLCPTCCFNNTASGRELPAC